ncbi:diguanylate cyclase [Denitratisoma oestradiolicum]|uniref:diguanylate cyclase n=1 Tax=Denitratisoma oestradiolicum TaxID=311182 RepID=A0A6S6XTB9_9PROT|nr:diguanylate cyclase [Denitratisoma oestradiolicum]TWO81031.1 sensor domain-containing diguanylate cyclase [Denitratisoma oestradiolicum]CAB1367403.1 Diguanylate cyclase with PAS/PAC sensor [Denitratisoma oestradiolicum]
MIKGLRIRYKIMLVVGLAVTIGLVATAYFYTQRQEQAVLAQNERTMQKLTESVSQGLQSVMLHGSADIASAYAERLKGVPEISDFRILRANGDEAFRDNKTINEVNGRRGEEAFMPRETEVRIPVLAADDPRLARVLQEKQPLPFYTFDTKGVKELTFLAPIENQSKCYKCHGRARPVRGVLKLTTSLSTVERDVLKVRHDSLIVLGLALMGTMLLTGYTMGRTVVAPIEAVTDAMSRVSGGALEQRVPIHGNDELGHMAMSFNQMTSELQDTYQGLQAEQDKLTTIIFGAGEGIVVTDSDGAIVLVNPAAERLIQKSRERIIKEGFDDLLDDPVSMRRWLADRENRGPISVLYKAQVLNVYVSTIHVEDGHVVGSACLLRDVTEEKRLEEELRRLSTTDGLTGLFNRRYLDDTLRREFERSRRTGAPLSVVMFDVDHFKKFNDTHGHDQGDRVLRAVATCLREALRKYDSPCRYGGEEFVGILPDTTMEAALAVAERLRQDVETMRVDGLQVTISLGVAGLPRLAAGSAEELIELADAALYQSKHQGRNRTTLATLSKGDAP